MAATAHVCNDCGTIRHRAPDGILRCSKCGTLGLIPCCESDPPQRIKCPQRGCNWATWTNRHADDYLRAHLVHVHPRSNRAKSSIGAKKKR